MSEDIRYDNELNFDLKQLTETPKAGLYTCNATGTQLTR